jgi:hypothetical protein
LRVFRSLENENNSKAGIIYGGVKIGKTIMEVKVLRL